MDPFKGFTLPPIFGSPTQKPVSGGKPVARWRELAGTNDWAGLLDPIAPDLRSELIRYGEFAQACYDAFDSDEYSKYCGGCKFDRPAFFDSLGMADVGYQATRYLYATSNFKLPIPGFFVLSKRTDAWSNATNWIGYVAVSSDEATARLGRRDILVAWRGTKTQLEWVSNLTDIQHEVSAHGIRSPDPSVKALLGWLNLYTDKNAAARESKYSVREQVMAEIKRLVTLYAGRGEDISISVTGHSLGSALATLSAYDLAELGLHLVNKEKPIPLTVYSFAGPRVGNDRFKKRFEDSLGIKTIRVLNVADVVPMVPGVAVNERTLLLRDIAGAVMPWSYFHVGAKLELDHGKSPFLKNTIDASFFHNLEVLLHLLDGYHGTGREFALASGRDLVLVNKIGDYLKDELMVPPKWQQVADRGLVRGADGKLAQPERTRFEDHPEDMDLLLQQMGISPHA